MKTGDEMFNDLGFVKKYETKSVSSYERKIPETDNDDAYIEKVIVMETRTYFERQVDGWPHVKKEFPVDTYLMKACLQKANEIKGRRICQEERR